MPTPHQNAHLEPEQLRGLNPSSQQIWVIFTDKCNSCKINVFEVHFKLLGGICPGGICPSGCMSKGVNVLGVSAREVYVRGLSVRGVSDQEVCVLGVSVQGVHVRGGGGGLSCHHSALYTLFDFYAGPLHMYLHYNTILYQTNHRSRE